MERVGFLRFALTLLAAGGIAGQATAQDCVDPPSGLISWWPGDAMVTDVGTGYSGEMSGGATVVPGLVGDAFAFNAIDEGQDDLVRFSHLAMNGLADLTVEFWVNTTDDNSTFFSAANGNDLGGNEFIMFQAPTGLRVHVNAQRSGDLPARVDDGAWHHFALAREGGMAHVYVDGVLVDSREYPLGALEVGPQGLVGGQEQDCLGGCFSVDQALDGMLDEVTVYGRALSQGEVMAIADAGSAGKCMDPMPSDGDELMVRVEDLEMDADAQFEQLMDLEARVAELEALAHVHTPGEDTSPDLEAMLKDLQEKLDKLKKWKKWKHHHGHHGHRRHR